MNFFGILCFALRLMLRIGSLFTYILIAPYICDELTGAESTSGISARIVTESSSQTRNSIEQSGISSQKLFFLWIQERKMCIHY